MLQFLTTLAIIRNQPMRQTQRAANPSLRRAAGTGWLRVYTALEQSPRPPLASCGGASRKQAVRQSKYKGGQYVFF